MRHGIILIDKPAGMTSFGVVARLRRVLTAQAKAQATPGNPAPKRLKVGHTGTLDPFATGLMILVVGKECKNAQRYSKLSKVYQATITLGATSSTGDPEGTITPQAGAVPPSMKHAQQVLQQLTGQILQRPPAFSALKINGQRAYKLARQGQAPVLEPRPVTIHSIELVEYSYPRLTIRTHVSSGTYIRSLAEDIGQALGTGAYCSSLRRLSIADWQVANAQRLADYGITD